MAKSSPLAAPLDLVGNYVEIRTAGDLWKALDEGKRPAVAVSAISLGPSVGPNIAQPKFPKPADQLKWDVLDRALALCDAEGGNRAEAMQKLIARIALARGVDRREIINMPLAGFVEAANAPPKVSPEPLSEREQEVDDLIRAEGPLMAKEISNRLGIGEKVLYNHVVPALKKKRGLENKRSKGYFYPT